MIGGKLALGIVIGAILTLFVLLGLGYFQLLPLADTAFVGAILGALVAGMIGLAGQLLVMEQAADARNTKEKARELAQLRRLFGRISRILSIYIQMKEHLESRDEFSFVRFDRLAALSKPLGIYRMPEAFEEDEIQVVLEIGETELYNNFNVLDVNLSNFEAMHKSYEQLFNENIGVDILGADFEFIGEKMRGSSKMRHEVHFMLNDMQKHLFDSVFGGLVILKRISDKLSEAMLEGHGQRMFYLDGMTEAGWRELNESVDLGKFS